MNGVKVLAIILIVAGVLGLVYGGFTYTRKTGETSIGPIDLSVNKKESVSIPLWAGIGAIVVGGGLLLVRRRH